MLSRVGLTLKAKMCLKQTARPGTVIPLEGGSKPTSWTRLRG